MTQVTGKHPTAVSTIEALLAQLVEQGAWFNKEMTIEVNEAGEIAVLGSTASTKVKNYMRLPVSLLPPLEFFDLSLDDEDRIVCRALKDDATVPLMQLMVQLYNETDKIGFWKRTWPFATLSEHPALLQALAKARGNSPKVQDYQALMASGDEKALWLKSFLGSRQFNLKKAFAQTLHDEDRNLSVLLLVVDFLNHKWSAPAYDISENTQLNLRTFSQPDPETGELFIRYNQYDAVDTYLFYGFVDTQAPWLFSVPIELTLGDKILTVLGQNAAFQGKLPQALRDLRMFMPAVVTNTNDKVTLTKLVIPHEQAPMALRRILGSLVNSLSDQPMEREALQQTVLDLEGQVLAQNQAYWDELAKTYQAAKAQGTLPPQADEAMQTLIGWANQRLQAYRERLNLN
jgi:hypothetical protein